MCLLVGGGAHARPFMYTTCTCIGLQVGGGNFFRGAQSLEGLERATGDYVGMLATVMNALCLQVCVRACRVMCSARTFEGQCAKCA